MANTSAAFGYRSFGHRDGSAPTMGMERLFIFSSDTNLYFTGDPVARSSATPGCIQPFLGSSLVPQLCGIFAGCEFFNTTVNRQVWSPFFPGSVGTSSASVIAYVITDPEMQYLVQCSSGPITSSFIGQNVNTLSPGSSLGNQTTGISAVQLSATPTAGSSLPFKIVDFYSNFAPPGVNGVDNTTAFNMVVVVPNQTDRRAGTTGLTT